MQRAVPARQLLDFFPIDIAAIKAVTGARVRGKLRPQIFDLPPFADSLPEITHVSAETLARSNRWPGRRRGGGCRWRAHRQKYRSFFFVSLVARLGIFGTERAAELHGAESEAIAQMIRGARQLFKFDAAFRGEQIELLRAVRQAAQADTKQAYFAALVAVV